MGFRYYRRVIPRAAKALSRFDRRVWLLVFAMLAFRFGHGLYFPFSSIYFHNILGIPLSLVGIGLAVFAAASVLSGLVAGPLTDRYGRKPLMLTALAGSSASFFAFSLVGGFAGYLAVSAAHGFVGVADGQIGFFLGANGLMVILFQLPVSYLIDRGSRVVALLAGAALFAASSATLLLSDSFLGIFVAFVLFFTLAEMVLEVAGASLAAELAPTRLRGTYLALFGACFGVACGFSPIVAGTLLEARLPALIWTIQLAAATFAAAGLVALALLHRRGPVLGA